MVEPTKHPKNMAPITKKTIKDSTDTRSTKLVRLDMDWDISGKESNCDGDSSEEDDNSIPCLLKTEKSGSIATSDISFDSVSQDTIQSNDMSPIYIQTDDVSEVFVEKNNPGDFSQDTIQSNEMSPIYIQTDDVSEVFIEKNNPLTIEADNDKRGESRKKQTKTKKHSLQGNEKKMKLAEKKELLNEIFKKNMCEVTSTEGLSYSCQCCDFKCISRLEAEKHALRHENKIKKRNKKIKNIPCSKCENVFTSKPAFNKHWRSSHGENECAICPICGSEFKSRRYLNKHLKTIHISDSIVQCSECDKIFKNNYHLQDHKRRMHSEKLFDCNQCEKQFSANYLLTLHIKAVHMKLFLCVCCGRNWSDKTHLERHLKSENRLKKKRPVQDNAFPCKLCDEKFTTLPHLNRHKMVHSNVKHFECETCGKMFALKYNLNRHSKIHVKLSDYELLDEDLNNDLLESDTNQTEQMENEEFMTGDIIDNVEIQIINEIQLCSSDLVQNQEKISLEKYQNINEIICKTCGKEFSSKEYLIKHLNKIHQDSSENHDMKLAFPHKCTECDKVFATKPHLKRHTKQHEIDLVSPPKCQKCFVTFPNKFLFYSHRPCKLKCSGCSYETTKAVQLAKHVKRFHSAN